MSLGSVLQSFSTAQCFYASQNSSTISLPHFMIRGLIEDLTCVLRGDFDLSLKIISRGFSASFHYIFGMFDIN